MPTLPCTRPQTGHGTLAAFQETLQQRAGIPRTCTKCGQMVADPGPLPHDATPLLSSRGLWPRWARGSGTEIKGVVGEGGTGVVYRGRHIAQR